MASSEYYTVENIVDCRITIEGSHFHPRFLVKWAGYPDSCNTWEPISHFESSVNIRKGKRVESQKYLEYLLFLFLYLIRRLLIGIL